MSHLECVKGEKGSARTEPKIYQQLRDGTGAGIGKRNRLRQEETRILMGSGGMESTIRSY